MRLILAILAVFLINIWSSAREFTFEKITTQHGLSQNDVLTILQDSRGYMWFGTHDGLNRFDGYDFKVFRNSETNSNSINSNLIKDVIEDKNQNLWIGTQNKGISVYNLISGQFTSLNDSSNNIKLINKGITRLLLDSKHRVWATTTTGISFIEYTDSKNYRVTNISAESDPRHKKSAWIVHNLSENSRGEIIASTHKGIYIVEQDKKNKPTGLITLVLGTADYLNCRNFKEIKEGYLLGHSEGLDLLTPDPKIPDKFIFTKIYNGNAESITKDSKGNLWVGGFNGLSFFNYTPDSDIPFTFVKNFKAGNTDFDLSNEFIRDLLIDNSGILWIGTVGGGVCKYDANKRRFRKYERTNLPGSISHNKIVSITEDSKGNVWFGTQGGGMCLLPNENKGQYQTGFQQYDICPPSGENFVRDIIEVQRNSQSIILTGTGYPTHLVAISQNNTGWKVNNVTQSINSSVFTLVEDEFGTIWLGCYEGGIYKAIPEEGGYKYVQFLMNNSNIPSNIIRHIIEDSKGRLWFATSEGLMLLKREQKKDISPVFTTFRHDKNKPNSLCHDYVIPLFEDSKKQIWIGTLGGGISIYNDKQQISNGTFRNLSSKQGLPSNVIKDILEDRDGVIWISTNMGISRYNPESESIRNYSMKDGLQDNEFGELAGCILNDGEILFGGVNGFNAFYPEEITEDTTLPLLVLNRLEVMNEVVEVNKSVNNNIILTKSLNATQKVTLKHNQNSFTVHFSALHFSAPQTNQYKFRLQGFDEDWIRTSHQSRFARYTNVEPGKYVFQFVGSNGDGYWSKEPRSLIIFIKTPFWNTLWFKITFLLSIVILAYYRFRMVQKSNIELEKVVSLRTTELRFKNVQLEKQTTALNETNALLEERQQMVEEQSEELLAQKEILEEVNATKDKFYSILSHDLLNPFNTLLGYLELLKMKFAQYDDKKKLKTINTIYGSARLLYKLMQNLLQWSRAQRGLLPFKPEELNLNDLIKQEIEIHKTMATEKGIEVDIVCNPEKLSIIADQNMLLTIIRNLVSNAVKFTRPEGKILVEILARKDDTLFKIEDSGVGIKQDTIDDLFRIDRHYSTAGTAKERGTGLGLILCKEFVDCHNGKIWVESKQGIGSKFYFVIPHEIEKHISKPD